MYQLYLAISSREVCKPCNRYVKLSHRFVIRQASQWQCCWDGCQISEWSDNPKQNSHTFDPLQDLKLRCSYGLSDMETPLFSVLASWLTTINAKDVTKHKRCLSFIPGLDVVSYSEWQILSKFSRELTDNAVLVNVDIDGFNYGTYNRAVLHDWRKKTYIYEVYPYYDTSCKKPCL